MSHLFRAYGLYSPCYDQCYHDEQEVIGHLHVVGEDLHRRKESHRDTPREPLASVYPNKACDGGRDIG